MAKASTKAVLLETGKRCFLEKGYSNTGIEAVLHAAGVPKGSFYYYFDSKEDFGLQVLDHFAGEVRSNFERCLADTSLKPLDRLRRYFEEACDRLETQDCRNGCLVGNLSQELADQSEAFRLRLEQIFAGILERYVEGLQDAQRAGDLPADVDVRELAEFCLSSWQGAILRAKASRNTRPIKTFIKIVFGTVLKNAGTVMVASER